MRDPVDGVIVERAALDRGFGGSVVISGVAHLLAMGIAVGAAFLGPKEPLIKVVPGFAVALPPGGGGSPVARPAAPAPAPPTPVTQPPAPEPAPAPKIIKPPQEQPRRGLPDPTARPSKRRPEPAPVAGGGSANARGSASTPGFALGPPGPGVPGGTDPFGDWYLAAVQRKIWILWAQQVKSGMTQPAIVAFTIEADGSVSGVQLAQSSGVYLIDSAAQRAVLSASPFGPLPRTYGTNRITIQGIFKPGQ